MVEVVDVDVDEVVAVDELVLVLVAEVVVVDDEVVVLRDYTKQ